MMRGLHFYTFLGAELRSNGEVRAEKPDQMAGRRMDELQVIGEVQLSAPLLRNLLDWLMLSARQMRFDGAVSQGLAPITVAPMRMDYVYVNARLSCFDDCKELYERLSRLNNFMHPIPNA